MPALIDGLVADNGIVYAGNGKALCALDAPSGKLLWQNDGWTQGEGTTSTLSLGKNILVGSAQWKGLYGNDPETGELKWSLSKNGISNRGASAAIHGNLVYVTASKSLFIIESESGKVIVRKEFPFSVDVTSTPLLTEKFIVFGSVTDGLIAVDKETLKIQWKFETEDALIYTAPYTRKPSATIETSPVLAGNTIYFSASDGNVYGINKETGELLWKHSMGAPILGSVAVSGNALVVTDFGGNVTLFTRAFNN